MNQQYKTFTVEVGIEGPGIGGDNIFELEISLYQHEIDKIEELFKNDFWTESDDIEPWCYIQDYMPETFARLLPSIMNEAEKKYGSALIRNQDNSYNIFIPEDIIDRVYSSKEFDEYCIARDTMTEKAKSSFYADADILSARYHSGRWKDLNIFIAKHETSYIPGMLSGGNCRNDYNFEVYFVLQGQESHIRYSETFWLKRHTIEFNIYSNNDVIKELMTAFKDEVEKMEYSIVRYWNNVYSSCTQHAILINGKEGKTGVDWFILLLDRLTMLTIQETR